MEGVPGAVKPTGATKPGAGHTGDVPAGQASFGKRSVAQSQQTQGRGAVNESGAVGQTGAGPGAGTSIRSRQATVPDRPMGVGTVAARSLLAQSEQDLRQAGALLEASRTRPLDAAQQQKLSSLIGQTEINLQVCAHQLRHQPGWLAAGDPSILAAWQLPVHVQERFEGARGRLHEGATPPRPVYERIETTLPVAGGPRAAFDCLACSGTLLRGHSVERTTLEENESTNRFSGARYFLAPDMKLTGLRNAEGQALYTGLRHGLFHAHELDSVLSRGVADNDALRSFVHAFRMRQAMSSVAWSGADLRDAVERALDGVEDDFVEFVAASHEGAKRLSRSWTFNAYKSAFSDLAMAALFSDAENFSAAAGGTDAELDLFSIALLAPEDLDKWRAQHDRFRREEGGRISIREPVATGDARPRLASATVRFRQFALPMAGERLGTDGLGGVGSEQTECLLGSLDSRQLGGDAGARVDSIRKQNAEMRGYGDHLRRIAASSGRTLGANASPVVAVEYAYSELQANLECREKRARTLEQCGQQLKSLWREERGGPADVETRRQAAARLALLGYLLGGTPVLNCASGRVYAEQVEAEAKLLAAVADRSDGHLPPMAPASRAWQQAVENFGFRLSPEPLQ